MLIVILTYLAWGFTILVILNILVKFLNKKYEHDSLARIREDKQKRTEMGLKMHEALKNKPIRNWKETDI